MEAFFTMNRRPLRLTLVLMMVWIFGVVPAGRASQSEPGDERKPAKLKVSGFGLLGNRELNKIIRLAHGEKRRPRLFDANFIEDGALILLSRAMELGHLEPHVLAVVTREDGSEMTIEWDRSFETMVSRGLQARRVHFKVRRGVRYYYEHLEIQGLKSMKQAQAERYFISVEALLRLKGSRVYTPQRLDRSLSNLREALARMGYAQARVEVATFQQDDRTGAVRVGLVVDEGLLNVARSVEILTETPEEGLPPVRRVVRPGVPYSPFWVQDFTYGLRTNHYRRGHPDVNVRIETVHQATNATRIQLDLEAYVDPGRRVEVGEVRTEGNRRTRDFILERRISVEPGDGLNPLEVERGRQKIAQLGIFDSVGVQYEDMEEGTRNVVYQVEESRTFELSLLAGYGSYEMLRGGVELEQRNVFGLAHDVRLRGIQSFKATSGDFRYTIPQMFGEDVDLFASASGLRREEVSFVREEYGGGVGVRRYVRPIHSDVTVRYDYGFLNALEQDLEVIEQVGLKEARVAAFIVDFNRDRRDNPLSPRRGLKLVATVELASESLGGQVDYQRIVAGGSYHLRLGGGRYLHAGVMHGMTFVGGGVAAELPFNKRFFPGGESSVRGYQQGEASPLDANGEVIGAETYLQGNLELEQLLTPSWSLVAFVDGVGIARSRDDYPFDETLYSVGGGIRWRTLIGPVRFEYGHNLNRRRHDPRGTFHFSIGFPF
jgi:outer membrane protein insertion porin family